MIRTLSTLLSSSSMSLSSLQQLQQQNKRRKLFHTTTTATTTTMKQNRNNKRNGRSINTNRWWILLVLFISAVTTVRRLPNHQQQNHHRLQCLLSLTEYIVRPIVVVASHYYYSSSSSKRRSSSGNDVNTDDSTPFWNTQRRRRQYHTKNSDVMHQHQHPHQRTIHIHHDIPHYQRNMTSLSSSSTDVDYCSASSTSSQQPFVMNIEEEQQRMLLFRQTAQLQPEMELLYHPKVVVDTQQQQQLYHAYTPTLTFTASSVMEAFIIRHQLKNQMNVQQQQQQELLMIQRGGHIMNNNDDEITSSSITDLDDSEKTVVSNDEASSIDKELNTDVLHDSNDGTTATATTERLDSGYKPLVRDEKSLYQFSFFQVGDGSDDDPDGIPTRYMIMQNNHRQHAKQAVQSTLQWRSEHNVDTILQRPHVQYDIAKTIFPHYFVEIRDIYNHIIFIQRPALLNLPLAEKNNLSPQQLLDHYIYVNEYLWQILEGENALATMTSIIDLQGMNLKYLRQTEIVNFMKEFVKTMDNHYPQRAYKTFIINAPKWFNILYKIVSPLLRESTKAKIEIYTRSKRQDKALHALVGGIEKAERSFPASFFTKKKDDNKKKSKDKVRKMMKKNKNEKEDDEENTNSDEDGSDENNNESDLPPLEEENVHAMSSKFEADLRDFTLARIQDAGLQMLEVVPL